MPTYSHRTAITMWMSCGDDSAPAPSPSPAPAPPLPLPPVDVGSSQAHHHNGLIFVSIACFRDAECQWTLHNLFHTATDPHRLRVGVVWQVRTIHTLLPFLCSAPSPADSAGKIHSCAQLPAASFQVDAVEDAEFVRMAGDTQYARYVRQIRIDWREATGCALPQKRSRPHPLHSAFRSRLLHPGVVLPS